LEPALAEFREASRLEPTNALLWLHLGKLYERMGRGEDALDSLQQGLEANPGDAGILNQIGWFYATVEPSTLRDPAKALDYAQRAVAASDGRDANILDTLAEAHYANRDFDAAIEAEEKAMKLAPDVEAFRNRLQKFREAKAAASAR
jgi:tetratricopeptide (TPR) repeat protein